MVIRDVTIRRGTAFLEPKCVELKGHQTADRDERREAIFLRGLKLRLGYVPRFPRLRSCTWPLTLQQQYAAELRDDLDVFARQLEVRLQRMEPLFRSSDVDPSRRLTSLLRTKGLSVPGGS